MVFVQEIDGILAGLGRHDAHVLTLQDARQREDIPDIVVDDEHLAPGQSLVAVVKALENMPLPLRQRPDRLVKPERALVHQTLRRRDRYHGHIASGGLQGGLDRLLQLLRAVDDKGHIAPQTVAAVPEDFQRALFG